MKITTPILKQIALQLTTGNPWWALVFANEYVDAGTPLHHALVQRFISRIGPTCGDRKSLADTLITGSRYNEIPPHLQPLVGKRTFPSYVRSGPQPRRVLNTLVHPLRRAPPRVGEHQRKSPTHRPSSIRRTPGLSSLAPHATLRGVRMFL
jgi:hypothetical protein